MPHRADDYNYPFHLERISTLNTFEVSDLGAFEKIRQSKNYTKEEYRINRWSVPAVPPRLTGSGRTGPGCMPCTFYLNIMNYSIHMYM